VTCAVHVGTDNYLMVHYNLINSDAPSPGRVDLL